MSCKSSLLIDSDNETGISQTRTLIATRFRSEFYRDTFRGIYTIAVHFETNVSLLSKTRRWIKIEILSDEGGHLVYEWNAGNTGARAHACAGDNLVCVHMINGSPLVLWTFDVPH